MTAEAVESRSGCCATRLEGPVRNFNLLKAIVWKREELEHRQHKEPNIGEEARVVLHGLGADKQLATSRELVETSAMPTRDERVLLPVDDEQRGPDQMYPVLAGKA